MMPRATAPATGTAPTSSTTPRRRHSWRRWLLLALLALAGYTLASAAMLMVTTRDSGSDAAGPPSHGPSHGLTRTSASFRQAGRNSPGPAPQGAEVNFLQATA